MRAEDAPQAYRLECENFSDPWTVEQLEDVANHPQAVYLVAEETPTIQATNGGCARLLGLCGVRKIVDVGEITNVSVDKTARRCGIATHLFRTLLAEGRSIGCASFTLEVRVSNHAARALYEAAGFVSSGVRPGFYDHPKEDAVIYWLR